MKTILFQGDSITDTGRDKNDLYSLGFGYASYVSASLGFDNPNVYKFMNKGISGNRSVDMYARIKCDLINLKPDYLSVLIGVNDVWHEISNANGVDTDKFEKILTMFFEEVLEALPNIKVMLLEPFVLEGTSTKSTDENPTRWDRFSKGVSEKAAAVKRVAEKFGFPLVLLQDKFYEAAKLTGDTAYWLRDGVHPTEKGHELIKREWLKVFSRL